MAKNDKIWNDRYTEARLRQLDCIIWFPLPFLIPFALVLYLMTHVLSGSNVRLGSRANVLTLSTPRSHVPTIWFAAIPRGHDLHITTAEQNKFTWNLADPEPSRVSAFGKYLRDRGVKQVEDAAIAFKSRPGTLTAFIAIDQSLTFYHMVPILQALVDAGIYKYEFETIIPSEQQSPHMASAAWQN